MDNKNNSDKTPLILKLGIYNRLMLATLFPERCSIEEYLIFDDLKKKIAIGEEEANKIGLTMAESSGTMQWDSRKEEVKEVIFTDKEVKVIVNICEFASRKKNFPNNPNFFSLYKEIKDYYESLKPE